MALMKEFTYRPEVDGLRALAVLMVVFFHVGLGFPGGYVGVDIFFVISGYLITTLILKDLKSNSFSLVDFWERRARRILPASIVMVFFTTIAGWFLLLPSDFVAYGKSAISQSVFAANIYFWQNTNYFAGSAIEQPLLHTWSLAVEEQFYLILPITLLLLFRFKWARERTALFLLLGASFLLSLILSIVLLPIMPAVTFYLLPTRAWELLCGSLIAVFPLVTVLKYRWLRELMVGVGLLGMVVPCLLLTKESAFPGLAALPACLGAALFILGATTDRKAELPLLARPFSSRPIVFIGLISYSLYLWHWPLVAFSHYWSLEPFSLSYRWLILIVSVVLAILSWRFVETPFRKRQLGLERRTMFGYSIIGLVIVIFVSATVIFQKGAPFRFDDLVIKYEETKTKTFIELGIAKETLLSNALEKKFLSVGNNTFTSNKMKLFVWGDSHAQSIMPAVENAVNSFNANAEFAWAQSTPPVLGLGAVERYSLGQSAIKFNQSVFEYIVASQVTDVLLAARWSKYLKDEYYTEALSTQSELVGAQIFKDKLDLTVQELNSAGVRVWILLEVPDHAQSIPKLLVHKSLFNTDITKYVSGSAEYQAKNNYLRGKYLSSGSSSVSVLDVSKYLYDISEDKYRIASTDKVFYYDDHHLSYAGAIHVSDVLKPIFQNNKY